MTKPGLYSLIIRCIVLASKFILMMFIARFLTPNDLGTYGLFTMTISLSMYFLGMEFYNYNTRELLEKNKKDITLLIREQFIFHFLTYIPAFPLLLIIFFGDVLPWKYSICFFILLVLEHLTQEFYRIFITLSRPVLANVILFLKSGAWIYIVLAVLFVDKESRNLNIILSGWIVGVLSSLLLAIYFLKNLDWGSNWNKPVDWKWIQTGIIVSGPFIVATLSQKFLEYTDRYFLNYYHGEAMVGVYIFYANIAYLVYTFVTTGVVAILYPKIITAFQHNDRNGYKENLHKLIRDIVLGCTVLGILLGLLIHPILYFVDKDIYQQHIQIYWILIFASIVNTLTYIPSIQLFINKMDKSILASNVFSLLFMIISSLILVPNYSTLGASISILLTNVILFVSKSAIIIYKFKT